MVFELEDAGNSRFAIPAIPSHGSQDESSGLVGVSFVAPFHLPAIPQITQPLNLIDINGQLVPFNTVQTPLWTPHTNRVSYGQFHATMSSPFAAQYSGFFVSQPPRTPNQPDQKVRFVLAPTDVPNRYCQDGYMGFAPALPGTQFLKFRTEVGLLGNTEDDNFEAAELIVNSEPREAHITLVDFVSVPRVVYNVLEEEIERITDMTWTEFGQHPDCQSMIDQLPTIRYRILDENNIGVVEVLVAPSDYVVSDPGAAERCHISVVCVEPVHQSLGLPFFRSAGVYVDYQQQRFGFCDPI